MLRNCDGKEQFRQLEILSFQRQTEELNNQGINLKVNQNSSGN